MLRCEVIMEDRIQALDDATAVRLLATIVRPHLRDAAVLTEPTPELYQALVEQFGPPSGTAPTEGDLARHALLLLASHPDTAGPLSMLLDGPPAQRFGPGETVVLITSALVVLQLHVRVERTTAGKWKVLFERQAATEAFLKPLVGKLLAFFSEKP